MRVIVDKMPTKPEECLFSTKIFKEDKNTKLGISWCYGCGINGGVCEFNFEKMHKCNKLDEFKRVYHMLANY